MTQVPLVTLETEVLAGPRASDLKGLQEIKVSKESPEELEGPVPPVLKVNPV